VSLAGAETGGDVARLARLGPCSVALARHAADWVRPTPHLDTLGVVGDAAVAGVAGRVVLAADANPVLFAGRAVLAAGGKPVTRSNILLPGARLARVGCCGGEPAGPRGIVVEWQTLLALDPCSVVLARATWCAAQGGTRISPQHVPQRWLDPNVLATFQRFR
jgi:hypothetical protein